MSLLTDCTCRVAKTAVRLGYPHTIILTSEEDARTARLSLAGVLPIGSVCGDDGIWSLPSGATVEVCRYSDEIPDYTRGSVAFHVCHGTRDLSIKEISHVQRWRKSLPALAA